MNSGKLAGCTLFITGASRGIGKAIAVKAAKDGANIVIAAKTADPHPKLSGTIFTACKEVEDAGGKCLPCVVDVRDENQIQSAIDKAVEKFGGIDIVVNNASAISLTGTAETDMKRYDLMHNINTRGTFLVSKLCLPYLKKSSHAHILNLAPPLNMEPKWFANHVAYSMAKYGMSMCVLGMHEEFKPYNIAVNALWPRTAIHTAALEMLGGSDVGKFCRKPDIMADAAYYILCQDPKKLTGQFLVDDEILAKAGVTDLSHYAVDPANKDNLQPDFFIKMEPAATAQKSEAAGEGQIGGLFKKIESSISPKVVAETQAVFQFNVTGDEAGKWFVDLKTGNGCCGKGDPPGCKPDATLTMDSHNFFDMFAGKLKPATAFMMGKLQISGNMQKALKLEKLMSSLKAKL